MAGLLVIHRSDAALERDAVAGLVGVLRDRGHAVVSCSERAGIGGGEVADLERQAEAADHILLVDPTAWWTRGPARDAWEQAVRERLEFCLANAIEQFAMIVDRSRERSALDSLLESVPRFVLPAGWEPLLARLAEPRPTINTLRTSKDLPAPRPVIPRPAVERALAQAVTTTPEHEGRLVWIRGGIGSGKTSLLSTYLSGRFAPTPAIVHVAQPGIAATLRPGAVLDRLAATLGLARLDDLRELPSDGSRATVVVIDGLEQLIDRTDALVSDAERRRFAASLAGPLPARLVVLASSRPLAPGLLGEREPTIDLDAPGWAAEQQALVDALLSTATGSEQREAMAALRELAGPNPGAARALLELRGALGEGNIPPRFAAALERSFVRLLALPVEVRQTVLAGLSLLRAGFGPLPDRLLRAALGVEAGLLEGYAAEWLRRDGELRSLTHPFAARYLASELDGDDVGPHLAILDGITRLRCRARLDAASERYAAKHERRHQQAAHGLWPDELWLRDLPHLQRMAAEGSLERKLEQAAAKVPSALVTAMSSIVRRNSHAIAEAPASLPGLLWTELVAQDIPLATVESELIWAEARPPIRLQNPLHHVDRCHRVLAGHDQPIRGCGLSRDASVAVTLSQDGVLRSWEPKSGAALQTVRIGGWTEVCAMTPDGHRVAVGGNPTVSLFDPRTGERLGKHDEHQATVTAIAISSDGTRVLSGDRDGTVVLWEVSREQSYRLGTHKDRVTRCTISSDGALGVTGGTDKLIQVWSLAGARQASLRGHSYGISGLALTRDAHSLVSICIGEVRVWDPEAAREIERFDDLGQNSAGLLLVADDREVLMAEAGERITRWKLDDGEITTRHLAHPVDMHCVAATDDGEWYLTGGADHVARLWRRAELTDGEQIGAVLPIAALLPGPRPDTVWAAGAGRGTRLISLTERRDGEPRTLVELQGYTNPHALARIGDRLYLAGTSKLAVYSTETGAQLSLAEPGKDWLRSVAIDPQRERLACAGDDKLVFVSSLDGRRWTRLSGHREWIHAIAFAPDGRLISVDGDAHIKVWDLDVGRPELELASASSSLYALAVDSTSSRFVTAGLAGIIEIFSLGAGQKLARLDGHVGPVRALALRADDRVLASVGTDRTLRLWSFADGRALACLRPSFPLTTVTFVGQQLVIGDVTGNVLIFEVDWSAIER